MLLYKSMRVFYHLGVSLELTVLGSGNSLPGTGKSVRNPSGYAVRAGQDVLLLDLGFGNVRQLARAGIRSEEVSDVFLTHRHPDHCGDLPALLFAFHAGPKPKRERLRVWGPMGTKLFVSSLCRAWTPWLDPKKYALEVRELSDGGEVQGLGWVVEAKAVPHTVEALGYRVTRGSASLVYSGDMEYDPAFARFATACDLLVLECTSSEDDKVPGHLSARQAVALAKASACGKAILSHLSPSSQEEAARLIKDEPRFALARDLMRRKV